MQHLGSLALTLAGTFSALAALAHLACIAIGAPAYRVMGAGERMARAAELGQWQPTVVTLGIAACLGVWALFAFSGAGWGPRLPLAKWGLVLITGIYLARGFAYPVIQPLFPGNSTTFWVISSGICLLIGTTHLVGVWTSWRDL
ncbi:hypothetical protein [Inhella gelatinilytica]|uniref:DUF423 domain-containing protein n=1 Tax=Inhella gelatinilytica TaxID=2795030 RepID=A0A931NE96_9BURK|nr:hypothetical protein [Inhella gelatinilytica]MBH9552276.1 hypothetical protein [Inhella gelatinilytica]